MSCRSPTKNPKPETKSETTLNFLHHTFLQLGRGCRCLHGTCMAVSVDRKPKGRGHPIRISCKPARAGNHLVGSTGVCRHASSNLDRIGLRVSRPVQEGPFCWAAGYAASAFRCTGAPVEVSDPVTLRPCPRQEGPSSWVAAAVAFAILAWQDVPTWQRRCQKLKQDTCLLGIT